MDLLVCMSHRTILRQLRIRTYGPCQCASFADSPGLVTGVHSRFCPLRCNVFLKHHSQNAFSAFVCSFVSFVSFLTLGYMPLDLEDELWLLL